MSRPPAEVEWEYAAGGGRTGNGYMYAGSNSLDTVAWHIYSNPRQTSPAGQKQTNELGLYDMSVNVREFCRDIYEESYDDQITGIDPSVVAGIPRPIISSEYCVLRGGCWENDDSYCLFYGRDEHSPESVDHKCGLRLAASAR